MSKKKLIVLCLSIILLFFSISGCVNDTSADSKKNDMYYFHISFDDTMASIKNLNDKAEYDSLFDEPFFGFLKSMHEKYNAKFSLYVYNDNLKNVTAKYKDEFLNAHTWLKFGLHSTSHTERFFKTATYEQGKEQWNIFIEEIIRITGSTLSVDRMPRLHYWEGCEAAMQGMRDADSGALGFLSADHTYPSYYLTTEQHNYAYTHDHIIDYKNSFVFVATDLRFDWFGKNYYSANHYIKPSHSSVYEELEYRFSEKSFSSTLSSYIVFGHEVMVYDGKKMTENGQQWIEDVCRFAKDKQIDFDFPQNRSYLPTPYDIH